MRSNLSDKEMAMYKPCKRVVWESITHGANCVCKDILDQTEKFMEENKEMVDSVLNNELLKNGKTN